ncbi:MAG: TIM barrel protein [Nanoarchaeota archaeon]
MAEYFNNEYEASFDRPFYVDARRIAATTSFQAPNQLYELQQRLNSGVKNVEISGPLDPNTFEQIPLQHFDELRRLAKLTGAQISLHAPMFDLAGFSDQGYSEETRKNTEEQFKSIIDRANMLDPEGNIPITVHTNRGIPSVIPEKGLGIYTEQQAMEAYMPELKGREIPRALVAIDQEEGRLVPLKYEEKEYLGKKKVFTPHQRLTNINETKWEHDFASVLSMQKVMNERLRERDELIQQNLPLLDGARRGVLEPPEREALNRIKVNIDAASEHIKHLDHDVRSSLNEVYHKLRTYGKNFTHEDQEALEELRGRWETFSKIDDSYTPRILNALMDKNEPLINDLRKQRDKEVQRIGGVPDAVQTLNVLSKISAPEVIVPVDDFIAKKAANTVVNTALHAYRQYGDKAPIIAVENWQPETALSRGESFQQFITKTKDEFAQALMQQEKLNEDEARRVADKLIGATWDVAHINLLRKYGYSSEDIVEEAKKVRGADIKKIHLADNFGYADSHLVMGMGNVPWKEQLEELKKTGLGNEIPMIGEFGAFDVQFKESSFPYMLAEANSPLYAHRMAPSWNAARDTYPDYSGGYGMILPDLHFREFYGGGFSNLPKELGGQMQGGDKSRFSGTPMQ